MDVDIGAANDSDKRRIAEYVAATLDQALAGQVHDMAGYGRTADAEALGDGLLRQHRILPEQFENLLFAGRHGKQMLVLLTFVCQQARCSRYGRGRICYIMQSRPQSPADKGNNAAK